MGDISPGTPVPQFMGQGGPAAAGDSFGVAHAAGQGAPQPYGNGTAQFGAAQAGAQWNSNFGKFLVVDFLMAFLENSFCVTIFVLYCPKFAIVHLFLPKINIIGGKNNSSLKSWFTLFCHLSIINIK